MLIILLYYFLTSALISIGAVALYVKTDMISYLKAIFTLDVEYVRCNCDCKKAVRLIRPLQAVLLFLLMLCLYLH